MQKDVLFPFKSFMDYLAEKKKHPPLTGRCSEKACCEVSPQLILSTAGHPSFYFTKLLFTQPLLLSFGKYTQVYPFRVQS